MDIPITSGQLWHFNAGGTKPTWPGPWKGGFDLGKETFHKYYEAMVELSAAEDTHLCPRQTNHRIWGFLSFHRITSMHCGCAHCEAIEPRQIQYTIWRGQNKYKILFKENDVSANEAEWDTIKLLGQKGEIPNWLQRESLYHWQTPSVSSCV